MNSLLILFIIVLLVRFICLKEGHRFSFARFSGASGLFLVALLGNFQSIPFAAIISVLLVTVHGMLYIAERRLNRASPALRTIILIAAMPLVSGIFLNSIGNDLRLDSLRDFSTEWLALLTAALLCLKESNFAIRWFFRHYKLVEKVEALSDAPSTENGRIIGNLERLLLLLFLWEGAALAATFIVAVKGLARFKKMEEHQAFAEYVIIGTFLSVLMTLLIYKATHWIR
jgi:hypothetical protein